MPFFQLFLDGVVPAFLCQKAPESGNKTAPAVFCAQEQAYQAPGEQKQAVQALRVQEQGTFETCYDGSRAACASAEGAGADGTNTAAQLRRILGLMSPMGRCQ